MDTSCLLQYCTLHEVILNFVKSARAKDSSLHSEWHSWWCVGVKNFSPKAKSSYLFPIKNVIRVLREEESLTKPALAPRDFRAYALYYKLVFVFHLRRIYVKNSKKIYLR